MMFHIWTMCSRKLAKICFITNIFKDKTLITAHNGIILFFFLLSVNTIENWLLLPKHEVLQWRGRHPRDQRESLTKVLFWLLVFLFFALFLFQIIITVIPFILLFIFVHNKKIRHEIYLFVILYVGFINFSLLAEIIIFSLDRQCFPRV